MDFDDILELMEDNFESIKEKPLPIIISLFIGYFLIEPAFQLSILTGILYIGTFLYVLLFKSKIIIEEPGYCVIIFVILAIRGAIGEVRGEGFLFLKSGDWITGLIFLTAWFVIYLKTQEIQRH